MADWRNYEGGNMKVVTRFQIGQKVETQDGILDISLFKGMKVSLDPEGELFEVAGWSYFRTEDESGLLIKLQEVQDQAAISEKREQFNVIAATVTVILAVAVVFLSVFQPTVVKGALGWAIQPVVGLGSWLLLIAAGIYADNRLRAKPGLGNFLLLLFAFVGIIVGFTLAVAIAPGDRLNQFPEDYAKYYEESLRTYEAGWKIVAGIVGIPLGVWAFFSKFKGKLDEGLEGLGAEKRK